MIPAEPLILSIDTSDAVLGVDVSAGGAPLACRVLDEPRVHASMLVPTVCDVMREVGVAIDDLDAVAVARGPGSYTGLRIGVSSAKGISYALDVPLIGVSTLHAMAAANPSALDSAPLITCLSSRKNELYIQIWELDASLSPLTHASAISAEDVEEFLAGTGRTTFAATGSGTSLLIDVLAESGRIRVNVATSDSRLPAVRGVSILALEAFAARTFEDVSSFEPTYLKEFVAKKGGSPFAAARNR